MGSRPATIGRAPAGLYEAHGYDASVTACLRKRL
jgi:hypothetical protein